MLFPHLVFLFYWNFVFFFISQNLLDGWSLEKKKNLILCLNWRLSLDVSGPNDLCLHELRRVATCISAAPFLEALPLIGQGEDCVKSQHVVGVCFFLLRRITD